MSDTTTVITTTLDQEITGNLNAYVTVIVGDEVTFQGDSVTFDGDTVSW